LAAGGLATALLGSGLGYAIGRREETVAEALDADQSDYGRQDLPQEQGQSFESHGEQASNPSTDNREIQSKVHGISGEPVSSAKKVSLKIDGKEGM